MNQSALGLLLAVLGLGLWLVFTQTARHLAVGQVGRLLAPLIVPIGIAAIWLVALHLHWWTIGVFVAVSLMGGMINGIAMRSVGKAGVFSAQPVAAATGALCVAAGWAVRVF